MLQPTKHPQAGSEAFADCKPIAALGAMVAVCLFLCPVAGWAQAKDSFEDAYVRGSQALDKGEYWIAEPLLKKSVDLASTPGGADMRLAKALGELGSLYRIRGRFEDAQPYFEEQLSVTESALGQDNPQIIPAMGRLIRFYLLYGTASKAYPLTEELLARVEGKLKDPSALSQTGVKWQKGMPLQGWAGSAASNMQDPVLDWAITCDELGEIYRTSGNLDVAERLFQAALTVKSTVLGKEHLSLANSYDSLGEICLARNEDKSAISYFRDALSYTERILPCDDPAVYNRLDKLAKCLIKSGDYKEAEQLYLRAQSFWKDEPSKCGNEARAQYALGSLYVQEKEYALAAPVLQQALQSAQDYFGPDSAALVPYLQRYAYALYYLGRKPESEQLTARASTISSGT